MSKYLKDLTLEEVLANPEKFDLVMDEVVKVAIERALIHLPKLILAQVANANSVGRLVEEFYLTNRDLRSHKPLVGNTINRLHVENPGMDTQELLAKVASEVRAAITKK